MKRKSQFTVKIITVTLLAFLVFGTTAAEVPVDELRNSINEKQKRLDILNSQILELQKEINRKQKETASLKNEISLYDLQIQQIELQARAVQLEIDKLSEKIIETQIAIEEKERQFQKQKTILAENLSLIYQYDLVSDLEITLSNNTFSQLLDQAQYAASLSEKNQELLTEIKVLKQQLEDKKAELVAQSDKQIQLKQELDATNELLTRSRNNKQAILSQTRGQERVYQSLLADAAAKQDQVEREIFELEISIRKQLGDKSLPAVEGLLRWPMSGILTQGYGNTGFTALGYSFHNGIDIAAPAGTKIYAAGDGVVYATGTGKAAYGNWVVVKHTINKDNKSFNIYTLYAHLRSFIVSPGQAIKGGDLIGYEGNTGNTTRLLYGPEAGNHLHFTVFDEEGFGIREGVYSGAYGSYQIPYGYTYNPMNFLK